MKTTLIGTISDLIIFDENGLKVAKFKILSTPEHDQLLEEKTVENSKEMQTINLLYDILYQLYEAANEKCLFECRPKDIAYMSDELDWIEVKVFKREPDGDKQEEYANDGEVVTIEEAKVALLHRINSILGCIEDR